jgi:hypothetical protein
MSTESRRVENLRKIKILLEAGTRQNQMNLTSEPLPCEFIFGIGKEGLTPFEFELAGKTEGDRAAFSVERQAVPQYFGHLLPLLSRKILESREIFYITIEIVSISPPSALEMVKAMAALASECACGCGCGGHGMETCDHSACGDA